jgi:hypothetical protein
MAKLLFGDFGIEKFNKQDGLSEKRMAVSKGNGFGPTSSVNECNAFGSA